MTELIKPTRKGANLKEPLLPCPFKPPFKVFELQGGGCDDPGGYEIRDSSGCLYFSLNSENTKWSTIIGFRTEENRAKMNWLCDALNEKWNRRPQSPLVAQVEVYRRALETISHHEDCLCKPGMEVVQEALLTSKPEPVATLAHKFIKIRQDSRGLDYRECSVCGMPEGLSELCLPVAPVRKWEAEDKK